MAHQALSVMRSSVGHDNLKYWIAAVAALGAAGLISSRIPDNEPGVVSKPRTAEQSVSWRSVERGEEFKNFVEDLAGKNQLTYFDLLKKEIPSYPLDKNNPSTLVALSAMKCLELLTSQETVYGLNSEQRNETCLFVRKLEGVIQATEAPLVKRADYSQHPYAYADTNITVEKFYGVVRAAIVQADIREQKYII